MKNFLLLLILLLALIAGCDRNTRKIFQAPARIAWLTKNPEGHMYQENAEACTGNIIVNPTMGESGTSIQYWDTHGAKITAS